jgi:hypothetical protein
MSSLIVIIFITLVIFLYLKNKRMVFKVPFYIKTTKDNDLISVLTNI